MRILFILLQLCCFTSKAQVQIQVIDPDLDTQELEKKKFKISKEEETFSSIPDKQERDEFLKGIKEIKDWDELQKDIFYMDLKSKSLEKLIPKYPQLSRERLKGLKERRD